MAAVPHAAWLSRIERAVRARDRFPHSALDIACGTGIVTQMLARRGYVPVVGVDLSEAMIQVARTKALGNGLQRAIEYAVQDAAALDLGGRRFDLLVSLFDSFNYILDPERLRAAFVALYAHAAPGAVLAFDLNSEHALKDDLFTQSDHQGPVRHDWTAEWDPATRLCRVEMRFWVADEVTGQERHFTETHVQRAYPRDEIVAWLKAAGFARIEVFSGYSDRPPNARSDRWLFVAERL